MSSRQSIIFLDGNGRIGRLLIPPYLVGHGLLDKPSLYVSGFFERNRGSYYDALMRVRGSNDLIHWLTFFLNGVAETATKGRLVVKQLLNVLYRKPIISAVDIEQEIAVSTPTANVLLKEFIKLGILAEITGQMRGRLYAFKEYLDLFVK